MTLYTTAQAETPTLAELEAQRADIDAKIAAAKLAAKADAIARVKAIMAELGVTQRMLGTRSQAASKPSGQRHTSAGKKVPAKYANAAGETWSGRGLMPKWLRERVDAGHSANEYRIETARAA